LSIQRCVEFRQRITEKRNSLKLQTLEKLLEPKEGLYKDDAMTKIEIETERLEKERQTQVQDKGSEQLSEIEQINSSFNENIENLMTKINREFEKKYYADLRLYYDKTKKLNTVAVDLYDLDVQLSQEVVFEMLIGNFQSFSLQIVTKVNEFVKSNPTVANVLKEMVIIQATNEEIFNPLANSNLPGVFQILHDRYHKRSFVNFTTSLIHATSWTLSDEDTKLNPSKGVAQIEEIINTWESTNLWDQMTPDLFFTCLLLKGLSSLQPIKREAINEAVKFIRMYNEDEERSIRNFGTTRSLNGSHVSKPIFKHISDFIRREEENRKMGHDFIAAGTTQQSSKTQQQVPKNAVNSTTNSNSVSNQWSNKNNSFVKTNTERAASAKESTPMSSADQKVLSPSDNRKKFESEIKKSANYSIQTGKGNIFPYVAVKKLSQICNKCYPENGPRQECNLSFKGLCYQTQCKTCNYYGHTTVNCMQSKTVNGEDF
jgi:hypothetical protein